MPKTSELNSVSHKNDTQKFSMPLRSYSESNIERDVKKIEKQIASVKLSIANHAEELVEKNDSLSKLEGELKSLQLISSIAKTVTV